MKPFAKAPSEVPRSGIREVMHLAAQVPGAIHLEVGQPDFPTPEHIVDATCKYAREGHTSYVANAGVPELRESVARYFERKTGVATTPDHILVTTGAVMSCATAFIGLLDPGDEVLLPDPGWPNYNIAVSVIHGKPVLYRLRPENEFLPDLDELDRLVTERTKLIVICTPSNPTGQVYSEPLMRDLVAWARRHDVYLLSDEIYGEIVFDDEHASALPHDTDERTLIVTGMSKGYAMTGYRVGFTRARPDYVELATKLQEPFVSCGTGFSQLASAVGLDGPQDQVREMRDAYQERRDVALEVLREHGLYRYTPGGAFYLLVDIGATGMDSRDFTLELLKTKKVAVAPGNTFGDVAADHIRISFASPVEDIRAGLERICAMIQEKSS